VNKLVVLGVPVVGLLIVLSMIICSNPPVFALPIADVSPTCGPPEPGFNIVINANGFKPNSNVAWKLVDSQSGIPLSTYFETNATGGFNQVTYIDDVKPGRYKMYLGTDSDNDGKFDIGTPKTSANITLPCP
jgi:hypothetical protein